MGASESKWLIFQPQKDVFLKRVLINKNSTLLNIPHLFSEFYFLGKKFPKFAVEEVKEFYWW